MALPAGSRLGPYEILSALGAGGMGEVYKARDTRLNRNVAIKVLPAGLSAEPDRLVRFEREARAAAALNHPNICAVFDIGTHDGAPFIVSELLEGETLRQVCGAGPLSVRRALEYAVPIARGLAAAHGKGIVHRDLKPENVFITTDARVKILDFGLAKLMQDVAAAGDTHLATAPPLTEVGIVVGTAGYMSPEQVRGLPTDSRSDIFSFGTVLFEMLAGRRPFRGDTTADTSSSILREDPPALMPERGVQPVLERIVRRCLEKAPPNRFQSAHDLAFALEAVSGSPTSAAIAAVDVPKVRAGVLLPVITTALAVVAVSLAVALYSHPPGVDLGAYRFTPFATEGGPKDDAVWSRDGRSIAYDMLVNGRSQIFVRSLDSDSPAQITHGSDDAYRPFWWPDANRVGFLSLGKVWSVSRAGGGPELVQKEVAVAATLSPDGQTLATWRVVTDKNLLTSAVWLASPPNAVPRKYTPSPFEVTGWFGPNYLQFSPDGRQLLLADADFTDEGDYAIWVLPFPDGGSQPRRLLLRTPSLGFPVTFSWMPDSQRVVRTLRTAAAPKGGLWMTDVRTSEDTPVSVGLTPQSNPSVSPDGSKVVFTAGGPDFDLAAVPLNGSPTRDFLATGSDEFSGAWVPGSSRYMYVTNKNGEEEVRIHSQTENWDRLIVAIRVFSGAKAISAPAASPDGQQVAYHVWGAGGSSTIWISPVGGGAPVKLTREGATERAPTWSPDGLWIACLHDEGGEAGLAIVRVGTNDPPRMLVPVAVAAVVIPAWSPNGEWIAYRTRGVEGAVRLVSPDGARQRLLATTQASALVWSRDSGTLYSTRRTDDGGQQMFAIDAVTGAVRAVSTLGSDFSFGTPTGPGLRFTLAPDGKSFLATVVRRRSDLWILENFAPRGGVLDWFRRRRSQ